MKITAYPEDTSPANNDLLLTVDVSNGSNKKVTVSNLINTIANIANLPVNGWTSSTSTISSVTYNGNRSYSLVTGTDLSSSISAGMRLRTTRTVAAPTQCTSLNGTNQYYSKSSPAGMTFTDDFVVSAWIKLSSYPTTDAGVVSRIDTQGWWFGINSSGQVLLSGANGALGNFRRVISYQSLPLNKWVHITAQLDMSSYTLTSTTCYIMFDGIDVPAYLLQNGTTPTSLVQAGNLQISGLNGSANHFAGKIAQVAIFNAKVTQATIRGYISQGLAGNETSLISAYSFNNSINDLNTTNANNLTANNSAVATNADSPFGGQADGTINSTLDYSIVQKVAGTSLTVQVPEGNTIPTSGGVSAIAYSNFKAPYGFPSERGKWQINAVIRTTLQQNSATGLTWYNLNSTNLNVPVGSWVLGYAGQFKASNSSASATELTVTLSTANNSETDTRLSTSTSNGALAGACVLFGSVSAPVSVTSSTPYYLNLYFYTASGTVSLVIYNLSPTIITAENAYL